MLESNHDLDQYRQVDSRPGPPDLAGDDASKDVDITAFANLSRRLCLEPCRWCRGRESRGGGDASVGSGGSFSPLTQRLLDAHRREGRAVEGEDARGDHVTLVNKNILLHYILAFLDGTANSIWRGTVLSIFVVDLTSDSNGRSQFFAWVGYLEGMFGLGKIFAKMLYPLDTGPSDGQKDVGSSARKRQLARDENNHDPGSNRQNIFALKYAGVILLVTAVANIITLATLPDENQDYRLFYQLLMPTLFFYGYSSSVLLSSSASLAVFEQSSPKKDDERIHDTRREFECFLTRVSSALGPLLSILVFLGVGNTFSIRSLRIVWFAGTGFELVIGLLSFGFSDRYSVIDPGSPEGEPMFASPQPDRVFEDSQHEEDDDVDQSLRELQRKIDRALGGDVESRQSASDVPPSSSVLPPSSIPEGDAAPAPTQQQAGSDSSSTTGAIHMESPADDCSGTLLEFILLLPSLLFASGSALFHSYWPVYFKDVPHLSPISVQVLYVFIPAIALLCDTVLERLPKQENALYQVLLGAVARRLFSAVFVMIIGTASYWGGESSIVMASIFVLREAFIDSANQASGSSAPFQLSVVMLVLWSVFAAVGGVLIDSKSQPGSGYASGNGGGGYGFVLRLTGALELVGVGLLIVSALFRRISADSVGSSQNCAADAV